VRIITDSTEHSSHVMTQGHYAPSGIHSSLSHTCSVQVRIITDSTEHSSHVMT